MNFQAHYNPATSSGLWTAWTRTLAWSCGAHEIYYLKGELPSPCIYVLKLVPILCRNYGSDGCR